MLQPIHIIPNFSLSIFAHCTYTLMLHMPQSTLIPLKLLQVFCTEGPHIISYLLKGSLEWKLLYLVKVLEWIIPKYTYFTSCLEIWYSLFLLFKISESLSLEKAYNILWGVWVFITSYISLNKIADSFCFWNDHEQFHHYSYSLTNLH